jgi:hypothetical protein
MARSKGTIAALVTVSAFAPVYSMVTFTSGGAILGNWVIGNCVSAKPPNINIINDITMDRTGLCMNLLNILLHF